MNGPICGSLFSGDGLLDFGLTLAGWDHAFLCESEPDCRAVLSLRWPGVPIYHDVRDVDGSAPRVDLLAFGFPCKGGSTAGLRTGLDHPETALWREAARVVRLLRPPLLLIENVANLLAVPTEERGRAWGEVQGDLAEIGYVASWDCLPAAAFRDRLFCVAAYAGGGVGGERIGGDSIGLQTGTDDSGRDRGPAADAERNGVRQQSVPQRGGCGAPVPAGTGRTPSDAASGAEGTGVEARRECSGGGLPQRDRSTASDSPQGRCSRWPSDDRTEPARSAPDVERLGVRVEWGRFAPAVERWEALHGRAPEPLCFFRGVDGRAAARVERSRLSALGDGVQMQAGRFLGAGLMTLAGEMGL